MKIIVTTCAAIAFAMASGAAHAGGWGSNGSFNLSSGLVNVSPSVGIGSVNALNGIAVLNGSPILSGNNVSGILSGNSTGILSGIGAGILTNSKSYSLGKRR
jgi:hypothetical protein